MKLILSFILILLVTLHHDEQTYHRSFAQAHLNVFILSNPKVALSTLLTHPRFVAKRKYSYNANLLTKRAADIMRTPFKILLQYLAPQHALSHFAGWLSECRWPWLKNYLIHSFLKRYDVDMQAAIIENPYDYPTFNSFFTRQLKPTSRPIAQDSNQIASPVDGFVSQIGKIEQNTLLQAKGFYFDLKSLLGGSERLAQLFQDGNFATLYLSPKDYHRVHMPIEGSLKETIYIPGKLFSVSQQTVEHIPNLFARNERLACIFDTQSGPMAVIFVGAMIVGSISTVWHANTTANSILQESYENLIQVSRGAELGHFKLGSTVIILFAKDKIEWLSHFHENSIIRMGEPIGITM